MASIKNLKKDINYTLGDLIGECRIWELENPSEDNSKSEKIIDQAIEVFDDLIAKVHQKNVENKKNHYKAISKDLESKANEIAEKINNL